MAKKNTSGVALVAGGSGIVGRAVAKELKRQGWTVRTLARQPIRQRASGRGWRYGRCSRNNWG